MIVHVLLIVLKVIGIILLSILGLILFIMLLLTISPIRYKVDGSYYEKPNGKVTVSWLLHILHVTAGYAADGLFYKVRVFGIPILKSKKKAEGEETEDKAGGEKAESPGEEEKAEDKESNEPKSENEAEAEKDGDKSESSANKDEKSESEENAGSQVKPEEKPDFFSFIDKIDDVWYNTEEKILEKLDVFEEKYKDIRKKLKLITNEKTEAAIGHVLKILMKILKSIMPRKLDGHIHFGMENPADTGTILGVLAATMPVHKNSLEIEPDFTEKVFEGEARLKGCIWVGYILFMGIRILLNRNVLITIKRFKKHFSSK